MVNPKEVMDMAWNLYRRNTRTSRPKFAADRVRLFARCLKSAWASVKETARRGIQSVAEFAAEEITRINNAIEHLYYRPFGMSVEAERRDLKLERAKYESMQAYA